MKTDDPGSFAALFEAAPKKGAPRKIRLGDVHDLEVVRVGKTEVFLALDGKQEGYIEAAELTGPDGKPTVVVGSRIAARVVQVDRGTDAVRLSPVSTEPILPSVADAAAAAPAGPATVVAGMRVKGEVVVVERYGVFVEFPVPGAQRPGRGLVPVSELGAPRGADLRKSYPVGSELSATVLSVDDRGRMRLSVTALAAAEERKAFETFAAAGSEDGPDRGAPKHGFGTFPDLLKRK